MIKKLILFFALALVFGCAAEQEDTGEIYQPVGLRKLTTDEIIHRIQNSGEYQIGDLVIRDASGDTMPKKELFSYDQSAYFADQYVDNNGVLKEVVIRKLKRSDAEAVQRIEAASASLKK